MNPIRVSTFTVRRSGPGYAAAGSIVMQRKRFPASEPKEYVLQIVEGRKPRLLTHNTGNCSWALTCAAIAAAIRDGALECRRV